MKLWDYIRESMEKNPNKTICEEEKQICFKEIIDIVEAFKNDLGSQRCCAILCYSEMNAAIALLSCFASGVTAVPLSVRYGENHCKKILDMISPTAIITDTSGKLQIVDLPRSKYQSPEIHPALIMCTSGTTGKPKGAMLTEENILINVNDICDYFEINDGDTILISRPLYHCAVLTGEFLVSLTKGLNIQFYSEVFNPKALFEKIEKNNITVFCGTPTMLGIMARLKPKSRTYPLKVICVSGECMSKETGKQISKAFDKADIYHVYGLTEACPRVSYLPPNLFVNNEDFVGIPLNSVSVKIVKADGSVAQKNEEGILWIKGGNVMQGYYKAPEQTLGVLKDGWLCTGDIAVIDSNGLLKIKGRSDDLIIRAGMNIYPQEIESTLKNDCRVREVLAYKIDNSKTGVQIGLKISGDFSDTDEVRKLCAKVLPSFQIPTVIELLDELAKNGSGKILRRNNNA